MLMSAGYGDIFSQIRNLSLLPLETQLRAIGETLSSFLHTWCSQLVVAVKRQLTTSANAVYECFPFTRVSLTSVVVAERSRSSSTLEGFAIAVPRRS